MPPEAEAEPHIVERHDPSDVKLPQGLTKASKVNIFPVKIGHQLNFFETSSYPTKLYALQALFKKWHSFQITSHSLVL